ncbi:MAG: hypothetical protein C5B48_08380 [Candidatus Rokuibacteriota bacterium]|nr:MAG: hypothetical protein C5B48_08380 [Candidatus Rokubacteria bacterium]
MSTQQGGQRKQTIGAGRGETSGGSFDSDIQDSTSDVVATHFHDGSFDVDGLGPGSPAARARMEQDSKSGTPLRLTSNDTGQGGLSSTENAHRHGGNS